MKKWVGLDETLMSSLSLSTGPIIMIAYDVIIIIVNISTQA